MPMACIDRRLGCSTGWPSTATTPSSHTSAPVAILISVDLPAPFSPTSAWTVPGRTASDTPRRARTPGNDLTIESSASAGGCPMSVTMRAPDCTCSGRPTIGGHQLVSRRSHGAHGTSRHDSERWCGSRRRPQCFGHGRNDLLAVHAERVVLVVVLQVDGELVDTERLQGLHPLDVHLRRTDDAKPVDDLVRHELGVGVARLPVLVVVVALAPLDVV